MICLACPDLPLVSAESRRTGVLERCCRIERVLCISMARSLRCREAVQRHLWRCGGAFTQSDNLHSAILTGLFLSVLGRRGGSGGRSPRVGRDDGSITTAGKLRLCPGGECNREEAMSQKSRDGRHSVADSDLVARS